MIPLDNNNNSNNNNCEQQQDGQHTRSTRVTVPGQFFISVMKYESSFQCMPDAFITVDDRVRVSLSPTRGPCSILMFTIVSLRVSFGYISLGSSHAWQISHSHSLTHKLYDLIRMYVIIKALAVLQKHYNRLISTLKVTFLR